MANALREDPAAAPDSGGAEPTPAPVPVPTPAPVPTPVPTPAPVESRTPPRTVAGSTWVLACIAVLILIVVIIFIAQNTNSVRVSLFTFHGKFPLSVALLAGVASGCVLTLGLGTTRILQLRRIVRRHHREDLAAAKAAEAVEAARETDADTGA